MRQPARLHLFLALTVAALHALSLSATVLWFGDKGGLHQIDTSANHVVLDVPFEPPAAVAVNAADGSVWALTQSRLAHLDRQGAVQFQVALNGGSLGAPEVLALNPNDASVWAGFQNAVLHFDGGGVLRQTIAIAPADLAIGQDGSLWILTQSSLEQHDLTGALKKLVTLTGAAKGSKHLALDDAGNGIWIAGDKDLVKLSLSAPDQTLLTLVAPETTSAISVDIQSGDLWFLGQNSLIAFRRDGTPRISRDLRDFSIANPQTVVYDFPSSSAWVGHQQGLSRITTAGDLSTTFPADAKTVAIAIGRVPLNITPVVSIVAPKDQALVNTGTAQFRVAYDALCGAVTCGFPNTFFSTFTLSALVNGAQVGSSFQFDSATGGATFTPAVRLPEGQNTWSVQASDPFGHTSSTVSATFTIDTIAPVFGAVTPPNNSSFTTPSITIAGSVDDPAATVTLGTQSQGQSFSFPVTLHSGWNAVTLTARDPAGNVATLTLNYLFNLPPSVSITSPPNNANFTAPASFAIAANASDPDGTVARVEFFVNGASAGVATSAPYSANATNLALGSYVLTAVATDNFGATATSPPVNVSVGPPNIPPVVNLTSPASGTSFSGPANIKVAATASDTDDTIASVEFLVDGSVKATVTTTPYTATLNSIPAGAHTLTARATDSRGAQTTTSPTPVTVVTTSIVITSPAPNATIAGTSVVVTGRIVALPHSGVTVNNRVAAADGFGNFYVSVDLSAGTNTITATVNAADNATLTQSETVNATGVAVPYAVLPSPSVGMAPLATTFKILNPTPANVNFTFNGSGPFSVPANAAVQLSVTYPAGIWVNTIVFSDGTGASYTTQDVIEARDQTQMDQMFRAIWSGLNTALAAGDKDGAMRYLNPSAQRKYGPVFDVLMPSMPAIVASYSPLAMTNISNNIGEYVVTRMDGTVKRVYFVYFVLGADGIWRLDEM